jgi:polyhydroxyalkanoate synthesis regulator phasin
MVDLIKKTLLAGVGLAFMTKEKAEEAAKVIVKETKIAEGEGKKFVSDLIKKSEEAKAGVEKLVNNAVHTALTKLDLPSQAEIKRLEARIRELEGEAKPAKAGHK